MKLEGIHHITAITGDAPGNLDFYTGVLGLRLVKKTVNQDDPTVYHLFYADEAGSPGADLTFFEYPGAGRGIAGAGMVHRIVWRVASEEALDFWERRLRGQEIPFARSEGRLEFTDPEGLGLALRVAASADAPLLADHPEIPAELALQGFDGVRAYTFTPERSRSLLEDTLGFAASSGAYDEAAGGVGYEARGDHRGSFYVYDEAPGRGVSGAGTVHHVAWASPMAEHEAWRQRVLEGGAHPTPVIDRFYFRSVYFREPSGVLFEIATIGPGFGADEDPAHLGEHLSLPPNFEHLRGELEHVLTPLPSPRRGRAGVR
jgi:glyoxalase family protein